jgi:RNase P subunit RPR2
MVEVLQRGQKPSERTYTATCRTCNSQLRFKASEAKVTFDQRDGDFVSVECPVCSETVNVNKDSYDKTVDPRSYIRQGGWKD